MMSPMPGSFLDDWILREEIEDWPLQEDLVAWFEPFGADEKLAWGKCERADFMVAVAASREVAKTEPLIRAALDAALEVSGYTKDPRKVRRALQLASSLQPGNIGDALRLITPLMRSKEDVDKRVQCLFQEQNDLMDDVSRAMADVYIAWHEDFGEGKNWDVEDFFRVLGVEARKPGVQKHRRALAAFTAHTAEVRATGAAYAAVLAASAHYFGDMGTRLGQAIVETGKRNEELTQLLASNVRARRSLFRDCAAAIADAAHAYAFHERSDALGWSIYALSVFWVLVDKMHDQSGPQAEKHKTDLGVSSMLGPIEHVKQQKLIEWGTALKPKIDLNPYDDEKSLEEVERLGARESLLIHVKSQAANLRMMDGRGAAEALEAAEAAAAILEAPGQLNKAASARALRTLEERIETMLANDAETAENPVEAARAAHELRKFREDQKRVGPISSEDEEKPTS